jgi:hypothetical protein
MRAMLDLLVGGPCEPALDMVEPGGAGRGEVQVIVIARVAEQPGFDCGRLVGGVIMSTRWTSRLAGTARLAATRKRGTRPLGAVDNNER